jgi:chaperonin cofactor prefoldin
MRASGLIFAALVCRTPRTVRPQESTTYNELQTSLMNSSRELQLTTAKLNARSRDEQLSRLTLNALNEMPEETRVHTQLGRAFLTHPLAGVKQSMQTRTDDAKKEVAALVEKKAHLEVQVKQVEQEAQEFIQAHLKAAASESGAAGSSS